MQARINAARARAREMFPAEAHRAVSEMRENTSGYRKSIEMFRGMCGDMVNYPSDEVWEQLKGHLDAAHAARDRYEAMFREALADLHPNMEGVEVDWYWGQFTGTPKFKRCLCPKEKFPVNVAKMSMCYVDQERERIDDPDVEHDREGRSNARVDRHLDNMQARRERFAEYKKSQDVYTRRVRLHQKRQREREKRKKLALHRKQVLERRRARHLEALKRKDLAKVEKKKERELVAAFKRNQSSARRPSGPVSLAVGTGGGSADSVALRPQGTGAAGPGLVVVGAMDSQPQPQSPPPSSSSSAGCNITSTHQLDAMHELLVAQPVGFPGIVLKKGET